MSSINTTFTKQHRQCDEMFADAEAAVAAGNWQQAGQDFSAFAEAMELHLVNEEEILFPAFEKYPNSLDENILPITMEWIFLNTTAINPAANNLLPKEYKL